MAENENENRSTRRGFIKKAGIGAGAVWAAPAVDSFLAPAAAAATSATCSCTSITFTHVGWGGPATGFPRFEVAVSANCPEATDIRAQLDGVATAIGITQSPIAISPDVSQLLHSGDPAASTSGTAVLVLTNGQILATCPNVTLTLNPSIPQPPP